MKRVILLSLSIVFLAVSGYSQANNEENTECYEYFTSMYSSSLQITYLPDNKVEGTMSNDVHDEINDYYTSSEVVFKGEIAENNIHVDMEVEIEGETVVENEVWEIQEDKLIINDNEYLLTECEITE